MKKSNFTGWQNVFWFEFQQATKRKAFIVLLVFLCAVALFLKPIMRIFQDKDKSVELVEMDTLYICDETGLPIPYETAQLGEEFADLKIQMVNKETADAFAQEIEKAAEDKQKVRARESLADIAFDQEMGCFRITFYKPDNSDYSKGDCEKLMSDFREFFQNAKIKAIDVSEEQLASISIPVTSQVLYADADGQVEEDSSEPEEGISMDAYTVMLGGIVIITMLISSCGGQIATSIVTEKSSKVIEYMMTNIRPMALIIGKILSALVTTVIQFAAAGICFLISNAATEMIFGSEVPTAEAAEAGTGGILSVLNQINVENILLIIGLWLVGVLFYCIIAGLCGASASKLEELGEALKIYQITMILGAYAGIAVCIMLLSGHGDLMLKICCLFPISAPFVGPAGLLMGKVSFLYPLIGLILLTLISVAVFIFASNIFEAMIFYNGKTLKLKDILEMSKRKKADKEGK